MGLIIVGTSSGAGQEVDATPKAARVILYDAAGNPVTMDGLALDATLTSGNQKTQVTNFPATQTVAGTVTANIGTTNGLALDATTTNGNQISQLRGAAQGTTAAANVTSTPIDANTQALDINIKESMRATYVASVSGQANIASSDIIAIESGAVRKMRIRQLIIFNPGSQTTAGVRLLQLLRTTTAGTAGAITPSPEDPLDPAYTGIVRAKPTALGTAGTVLWTIALFVPAAVGAFTPLIIQFDNANMIKPPLSLVGTANGIALRDPGATGAAGLAATIVFTEE